MKKSVLILSLLVLTLTPSQGFKIKLPKLPKVVKIVINPVGEMTSKATGKALEKVAPVIGVDSDALKKANNLVSNPVPQLTGPAIKTIVATGEHSIELTKASFEFAHAVASGDLSKMGDALATIADATVSQGFDPFTVYSLEMATSLIPVLHKDSYMDTPNLISILPDASVALKTGKVIYVNGIDTTLDGARASGYALAQKLEREVILIYNPTDGFEKDCLQSIYDRTWIITQAKGAYLVPNKTVCQANETTRALTHYLYHADERIALVTHSQGCLIARNAILAASRMRGEEKPESLISWVALAAPLRDEEIIKKPRRLKVFANKNDFVAGGLGMRMMGGDDKKNLESGHNFERYLGYINEDMLF